LSQIIDAHVHLSERRDDLLLQYAKRNGLDYNLNELLHQMSENNVVHGLLLSPILAKGGPLPNEEIIELCARSHGRLSPIITVEPTARDVDIALQLARDHRRDVKGFKILLGYAKIFPNDPVFDPLYDRAESVSLPVMYHTGDTASAEGSLAHAHPLTLDAVANERERLKIVACHFGNPWIGDVAELIYKHENVYADISGLVVGGSKYIEPYTDWVANRLSEAIYYAGGADKVIFGTDYPVTTYSTALSLVAKLHIDTEDREKILAKNARKVFRL
jgi:hypothetical protein